MQLFVRFGDAGDYETLGGIGEFIEALAIHGIISPLEPHNSFGVRNSEYQGQNNISLFFGADVETPIRGLTEKELAFVNGQIGGEGTDAGPDRIRSLRSAPGVRHWSGSIVRKKSAICTAHYKSRLDTDLDQCLTQNTPEQQGASSMT